MKISIPDPELGSYRIRLSSTEQRKNVAFKMAVGSAEDGLPFPVLPNNRTIRVVILQISYADVEHSDNRADAAVLSIYGTAKRQKQRQAQGSCQQQQQQQQ